jgi:hypothetical protein
MPYLVGILTLVILLVLIRIFTGEWNPLTLATGADKRLSTSKLQWLIWTVVVLFSYTAVYAERLRMHKFEVPTEIPANVLIALGLTAGTMTVAKGITVGYLGSGKIAKDSAPAPAPGGGAVTTGVLSDDGGEPDLSKVQLIAWTLIASVVYIITTVHVIQAVELPELPDIDPSLVVLMGLGQGAYLGKKLVTTTTPRLIGVTPANAKPGTVVTVTGDAFGTTQGVVTIDGIPLNAADIGPWTDDSFTFTVPATHPGGTPWAAGTAAAPAVASQLGMASGGQSSANRLAFFVSP